MKSYERLAIVVFPGALIAYLAGVLVARVADPFAALTVTLILTAVALYLGWFWAQREVR